MYFLVHHGYVHGEDFLGVKYFSIFERSKNCATILLQVCTYSINENVNSESSESFALHLFKVCSRRSKGNLGLHKSGDEHGTTSTLSARWIDECALNLLHAFHSVMG